MAACAPKHEPQHATRSGFVLLHDFEKDSLLKQVQTFATSLENLNALKGYAKIGLEIKKRKRNVEETVFIQLPASFRFETLDDLGNLKFTLASDGSTLQWFENGDHKIHTEALTEKTLSRYLPFLDSFSETLGLFFGRLPNPNFQPDAVEVRKYENGEVWLVGENDRWLWNPLDQKITRWDRLSARGKILFHVEVSEFKNFVTSSESKSRETYSLPTRILIQDLKRKNAIRIHYLDMQPQKALPEALFQIEVEG